MPWRPGLSLSSERGPKCLSPCVHNTSPGKPLREEAGDSVAGLLLDMEVLDCQTVGGEEASKPPKPTREGRYWPGQADRQSLSGAGGVSGKDPTGSGPPLAYAAGEKGDAGLQSLRTYSFSNAADVGGRGHVTRAVNHSAASLAEEAALVNLPISVRPVLKQGPLWPGSGSDEARGKPSRWKDSQVPSLDIGGDPCPRDGGPQADYRSRCPRRADEITIGQKSTTRPCWHSILAMVATTARPPSPRLLTGCVTHVRI